MSTIHRLALASALTLSLGASTGCQKLITAAQQDSPSASASVKASVPPASGSAAAAHSAASGDETNQITFKKKDPQVGTSFTVKDDNSMTFELTKPKKTSGGNADKAVRKIEILAAEGRTINRVKVTYTEKEDTSIDEGKETTKRPAVRGKGYVVESVNGKLTVADEARSKLKTEENDVVSKDMQGSVGKPDKMLSALPDVPLKIGDSANGLAEWLKDAFVEMGGDIQITSTSVKLKEVKTDSNGRFGVFDVKSVLNMKQGAINFKMDIAGTLEVRVDGRPQALVLSGPVEVKGGGAEGTGKLSISRKMEY
jgi:hypothetical protein